MNFEENNLKQRANALVKALVGSEQYVNKWWTGPNKAFDNKTPLDEWATNPRKVYEYLKQNAGYEW